jgi:copper transport protein
VAVALLVGAVAGLALPASAHAVLESTTPPSGTAVPRSPGNVVLHFDEQVSIQPSSVEVFNSSAKRVDNGTTRHVPGDSHAIETAVPGSLPAGGYVVTWRVVSADSHPVHGAFTFFIGAAAGGGNITAETSQLLARSAGNRTVGVVYGVVRWLAFVALAGVLGTLLFMGWAWPESQRVRTARAILWASVGVLAVTTLLAFGLQGAYGGGLGLSAITKSAVLKSVWGTRFGKAYIARLAFVAAIAALAGWLLTQRPARRAPAWWLATTTLLIVAMLATWGLGDHAATGTLVWLAVPFDVVHLGAASIWIGGLAMVVAVLVPASTGDRAGPGSPLRQAGARFSNVALAAVVAIVATGLFAAWRQVGVSWGALTTTAYGKLLLYKSGGLVVLVVLASVSRTAVHGRLALPGAPAPRQPPEPPPPAPARTATLTRTVPSRVSAPRTEDGRARRLRGAVVGELVVGLVVLALSAVLVEAQPAKQAYSAPYSTQVKAGPTFVNVVVAPAHTGPVAVHLYILTPAGGLDDVPEVDATMGNPHTGISGLTVPLQKAGPGHYVAYGFVLPFPGTWQLNVTVRTDNLDEYFTDPIKVPVR